MILSETQYKQVLRALRFDGFMGLADEIERTVKKGTGVLIPGALSEEVANAVRESEGISGEVFPNPIEWLRKELPDMLVDNISVVYPVESINVDGATRFRDDEEDASKYLDMSHYVRALRQLVELVDGKKLFVGGVTGSADLVDAGNWDVEVVDAFYQLAYHGEVIYG
jgi:hypothetical protein